MPGRRIGPSGRVIFSPVVRIQPRGQLALTGAGLTLMRLRGLPEVRVIGVAPRMASALPAIRFGGVPVFPQLPRVANVSKRPRLS